MRQVIVTLPAKDVVLERHGTPIQTCHAFYRHAMVSYSHDVLVRRADAIDAVKKTSTGSTSNHLDRDEEGLKANLRI